MRDLGLLASAVAMPEASFGGIHLHPTVPEMAAAYLFHITANHPFVDGNKRAGLAAALVFLRLNDHRLEAPDDELTHRVMGGADGRVGKAEVAVFIAAHLLATRKRRS